MDGVLCKALTTAYSRLVTHSLFPVRRIQSSVRHPHNLLPFPCHLVYQGAPPYLYPFPLQIIFSSDYAYYKTQAIDNWNPSNRKSSEQPGCRRPWGETIDAWRIEEGYKVWMLWNSTMPFTTAHSRLTTSSTLRPRRIDKCVFAEHLYGGAVNARSGYLYQAAIKHPASDRELVSNLCITRRSVLIAKRLDGREKVKKIGRIRHQPPKRAPRQSRVTELWSARDVLSCLENHKDLHGVCTAKLCKAPSPPLIQD